MDDVAKMRPPYGLELGDVVDTVMATDQQLLTVADRVIATQNSTIARQAEVIAKCKEALEQAIDDFGDSHSVCEFTKQLCIVALALAGGRS